MLKSETINFSEYYIYEFFDYVRSKISQEYSEENHRVIDELFTLLSKQSEITEAISKLAQEKASGELSIFLFDIFDRAQDYPPTELVDALPEIAEDFVSGLSLMLEEEGTIKSIKKVNNQLKGVLVTADIPESEQEIVEESVETETGRESERENQTFTEFTEMYFINDLRSRLLVRSSEKDTEMIINFTLLLLDTLNTPIAPNIAKSMDKAQQILKNVFPWRHSDSYSPATIMANIPDQLESYLATIVEVDQSIIEKSVEKGYLELPKETAVKDEYIKEEVPETPTTIDSLLSEYFQAEVDEYLVKLNKIFEILQSNPKNSKELNNLIQSFQSFKEICMIHGYVLLEDFSTEMIAILNQAKKENKVYNPDVESEIQKLLSLLKKTDRFKDAKSETPESLEVQSLLEKFHTDLFVEKPVKVKKEDRKRVPPSPDKKEISAKKKSAVLAIYKDLLKDLEPGIKENLTGGTEGVDRTQKILAKLNNGAAVLNLKEVGKFIDIFSAGLDNCKSLPVEKQNQAQKELLNIFDLFNTKISTRFKHHTLGKKVDKLMDTLKVDTDLLTLDDKQDLLKIVMQLEHKHGEELSEKLNKIYYDKDDTERLKQVNHYKQLAANLSLIDCLPFQRFPQTMITVIESHIKSDSADEMISVAGKIHQSIIDKINKDGADADIDNQLEQLKKSIESALEVEDRSEESIAEVIEEDETVSAAAEEHLQESDKASGVEEEDLDEIFKQESDNYLVTINQELERLKENPDNPVPYENIEKSFHSLKSSARLMGQNDLADVAAPVEEIFEILHETKQVLSPDDRNIIENAVAAIKSAIAGESINADEIIEQLKNIKINKPIAEKDEVREEQLFTDSGDDDEDLLDIFKDESAEYIKIVEAANKSLGGNPEDSEALGQLEHAMHSLKSAAKMLGFSEIGRLADAVELTAVAILKGEIRNNNLINDRISQAIRLIKDLTAGNKLDSGDMESIISSLDITNLKQETESQATGSSVAEIPPLKIELDEQTQLFIKEGWELLEKINRDLVNLEKNPKDEKLIGNLNRTIHTLKGSAQILNLKNIGILAHKIEDLFENSKNIGEGLNENMLDVVFRAVDTIQDLINTIKTGGTEKTADVDLVVNQIDAMLDNIRQGKKLESPGVVTDTKPKVIGVEKTTESRKDEDQFIKITTDNLDNLVNMAAELVISKTQLSTYLEKLKKIAEVFEDDNKRLKNTNRTILSFLDKKKLEEERTGKTATSNKNIIENLITVSDDFNQVLDTFNSVSTSFRSITQDFEQNIDQISNLTKSLHGDILQVRMVPSEMLFNRFPRAIRDMARKLKKKVNLVVEGEQTEIDRALVESLTDPVMHLVRNAIDHGIESPEERKEKGKSEDGIILLKAQRSKNQIIIEVQDDGKGIDPAVVKDFILKKGLAGQEEVDKMKDSELMDFVFHPGFSTLEKASDVSGRGVGLDVVADQLQKLNGDIRLTSTVGKGTIFSIRVPLTLAIAQAMLVKVASEILCIPLVSVEETVQFKDPDVVEKDERAFITVRDKLIPVVYLSTLLNYESEKKVSSDKSITAIIVQESGTRYGLIVDEVLRREEILIKSLGDHLTDVPYISGGTIFSDGSVCLILDIPSITQKMELDMYSTEKDFAAIERARRAISEETKQVQDIPKPAKKSKAKQGKVTIKKKKIKGRPPKALIIDDSRSVLKFVSSFLEKNKYETALAEDGPEALEELKKGSFDIIITDLEMPKIHGFDLIKEIRSYKKYQNIPIVILTGRAGKKDKEKGEELGANAYITKPFKENDLLKSLEDFIEIA